MRTRLMRTLCAVLAVGAVVFSVFAVTPSVAKADSFNLAITGGTIVSYGDTVLPAGTSTADIPEGALVTISAAAPSESATAFSHWSVAENAIVLPISTMETVTFTMPQRALSISASFKNAITILGVTLGTFTYGDTVSYNTQGIHFENPEGTPVTNLDKSHCLFFYSGRGTTTYPISETAPTHAGEYTLCVVFKQEVEYAGKMTVDFEIGKAPIVITGITAHNRAFDSSTDRVAIDTSACAFGAASRIAATDEAAISIVVDSDSANVFGTAENGGALGSGIEVTVSGISCAFAAPALESDYTVSIEKPTVDITGHTITDSDLVFTGTDSRTYDATASAITATPGTSLPSTLTFLVKDGTEKNAGTHTALILFDDGTSEGATVSGNYTLPDGGLQKQYTILPKPIDLVWDNFATRIYDGNDSTVSAAIPDGAILGTDACSVVLSDHTEKAAGTHTAAASLTGADSANYTVSTETAEKTYIITQKTITPGTITLADKPYDGTAAGTASTVTFNGLCAGDTLDAAQSDYTATVTFSQTSAGQNVGATVQIALGTTAMANNYTFMSTDAMPVATRSAQASGTGKILPKTIAGTLAISLTTDANANGKADTGDVLSAAYQATDTTGEQPAATDLIYQWKRAGADIPGATAASYTLTAADAGKLITCAVTARNNFAGSLANTTGVSGSLLPLSGTVLISGATSIGQTLSASLSGGIASEQYTWKWYRNTAEIAGATGSTYIITAADLGTTLYAKATAISGASAVYTGEVTGSILIPGGVPAAPVIDLATDTNTLSVSWNTPDSRGSALLGYLLTIKRAGTEITGSPFSLSADQTSFVLNSLSGGASFSATLTAINAQGRSDSTTLSVNVRAAYAGSTPDAPTRYSRSTSSITLTAHNGYEYSMGGSSWQDSNTFKGLDAGTKYTFYQRVKETSTHDHSAASSGYTTSTLSDSSSDDSSDSSSSSSGSSSSGSTSSTTGTSLTDKLYELSVSEANTNILYSTMNKLIRGNAEKAVTISFPRITYSFAQGTMTAVTGKVWYDLGVSIDNCVHTTAIAALAGDARVLTLHFNYDGTLPGDATIGIFLGTQYVGNTLYYYKYDETNNALIFQQNTTVDANGWANVHQTTCSDYVLLNRDIASASPSIDASASPSPTPSPTASATLLPVEATGTAKKNPFDWQLAGIIGGAALVLLGILWLCLKKRSSDYDDEDDEE